ncbi:MAG: creatininase family protein [Paludibacteraceae bacterium]|nr:creatininase family protein [Paludibacteraceae bacterium]
MNSKNIGFDLSVTPFGKVKNRNYSIAVLPWGATEPHNLHLPYLTDCILSQAIALDAAQRLQNEFQHNVMVLPPVAMGAQNPGQRDLPFCIHYRFETQKAILSDIIASLYHQGFRKLVIINGHGGNNFKSMIRDFAIDYPDFLIATTEWYTIIPPTNYFEEEDDHAGELETSVMMHYYPDLVKLTDAGEGKSKPFAINSLNEKTAWVPRHWLKVTTDTGIGNPLKASAEKGKVYSNKVVEKIVLLLKELIENDDIYQLL